MSSASSVVDFLQFLDVLRTSISTKTGRILAQLGSVTGRTVDGVNSEWWQHVGFISRPSKPEAGKSAARCVAFRRGNVDAVIASEDDRGLELKGSLQEGETCVYAAGEDGTAQGRILLKGDGTVAIYTLQGNTAGGASCTIQVRPDGEIHIASPHGGMSITSSKTTLLSGTGAGVELSASGVNLAGPTVVANGSVVLGDATATGVATQLSQQAFNTTLIAFCAALQPFINALAAQSGGTSGAAAAATAALAIVAALPTNYSLTVKAS